MLKKFESLVQDFCQLPLGFRIVSGFLGAAGVVSVVLAFSSGFLSALLPILIVLVVVVGLFLLVGWLARLLAKRRGRGMGASLWAFTTRKDRQGEIEAGGDVDAARKLRDRWKDVYQLLSEKGYDFYSLPWFLIIGPSQSGKTTLIQKSNQEFPIGEKPVADFGTKNCNWFFMNKAIILDTAGRYVEHHGGGEGRMAEEDRKEWEAFLSLLNRFRSRSPINGLILVVKVPDVLDPDPENRKRTAEILRKALHDIEEQLKIQCPVYVMVTMCDRMTGFTEFFSMLPGLSDRSLLGWSRSGRFDESLDPGEFEQGLQEVVGLLERLRLTFLNEKAGQIDRDREALPELDRLYSFPDEFQAFLEPLTEILKKAFEPSTFYQGHFPRGIYFTSALQKGEPILGACLQLLGENAEALVGREMGEAAGSKAFFIADFFEEKVFSEKGLVRLTTKAHRERKFKEKLAVVAGTVVALGTLGWAALSGMGLRDKVGLAGGAIGDLRELVQESPEAPSPRVAGTLPALLENMNRRVGRLERDAPTLYRENVKGKVREINRVAFQSFVYRSFTPALLAHLKGARAAETWEEGEEVCRFLTALLRLGCPFPEGGGDGEEPGWAGRLELVLGRLDRKVGREKTGLLVLARGIADLERLARDPEVRKYLQDILGAPEARDLFIECLEGWVLDSWNGILDRLDENPEAFPLARPSPLQGEGAGAWRLDCLHAMDRNAGRLVEEFREILLKVKDSGYWANTEAYIKNVRTPWEKARDRHAGIMKALKAPGLDKPVADPEGLLEERLARFRSLRGRLDKLRLYPGSRPGWKRWRSIKGGFELLENRVVKRNEAIRSWVVEDQRGHFLVRLARGEGGTGKEKEGGPEGEWRVGFIRDSALAREIKEFTDLVRLDVARDLDPDRDDFWELPQGVQEWRRKKLALFDRYGGEREPAAPAAAGPRLISGEALKVLEEGFRNRLDLAFYERIRDLCRVAEKREGLVRSLGAHVRRTVGVKAVGLVWDAFPPEGHAFTRLGITKLNGFFYPVQQACMEKAPWREFLAFDAQEDVGRVFRYYVEEEKRFWTGGLGARLRAALPSLEGAVGLEGREELRRLTTWRRSRPPKTLVTGVASLLALARDQYPKDEISRQQLKYYSGGYEYWKLYGTTDRGDQVVRRMNALLRAVDRTAKAVAEADPDRMRSAIRILEMVKESKQDLLGFRSMETVPGEEPFRDPVVAALTDYVQRISDACGRIGKELFTHYWARVGDNAVPLRGRFPFAGGRLPRDEKGGLKLAGWLEARAFFDQSAFRTLLSALGDAAVEKRPLFPLEVGEAPRECFRRCVLLARAMSLGRPLKVTVRKGGERTVGHSKWHFQVLKGEREMPKVAIPFAFESLTEFPFALTLDKDPHKVLLRAREGVADWYSFHPLPPADQDSPWNFLAWLWLWGEYEEEAKGFRVTVLFPKEKTRADATNATIGPESWDARLRAEGVPYLKLFVQTDRPLPDRPPDLDRAGWDGNR